MRLLNCSCSCCVRDDGFSTPGSSYITQSIMLSMEYKPLSHLLQYQLELVQIFNTKIVLPIHDIDFTVWCICKYYIRIDLINTLSSYPFVKLVSASFVTAPCNASDLKDYIEHCLKHIAGNNEISILTISMQGTCPSRAWLPEDVVDCDMKTLSE